MRAGLLRHRVRIEKPVKVTNTFGEVELNRDDSGDWATVRTVWASVLPIESRSEEKLAQTDSQLLAEVDHVIEIRYMAGLNHQYRAVMGGRIFEFSTVLDPDGRQRRLRILCKEKPTA